jgi:Tol biopolymer transport system component
VAVAAALILFLGGALWYLSRPLSLPRITAYTQLTHDGSSKQLAGTDGSRLYFSLSSPAKIEQVGVNGGDAAPVPLAIPATEMLMMNVSPDGSSALVATNEPGHAANPIWVASLLGGSARRIRDGQNPAFSPDGLSVIYWTYEGDIFLARIDGSENRKLAHFPAQAYSFSWSPDGKAIRFISDGFIWEMASDGSGLHHLLPYGKERGSQYWGRWTPNGRFYLFTLDTGPSSGPQICALDERRRFFGASPRNPIRLTTGPIQWGLPISNHDGTRIFAEGITPGGEISRIDPRSGALQPFLGGIPAEYVSFSSDGKSIAYVSFPDGKLWKADRDGGNRVLLAELAGKFDFIFNPRWSPTSQQILFSTTSAYSTHSAAFLISSEGGKPQKLVPGDQADMEDPNWSADGKKALFFRGNAMSHEGDLRILTLESGQVAVVPGSSHMWSPRWSPDGRYILAQYIDQRPTLPLFDFKIQKWSTLPVGGDVEFPSFSHDSRYIYFLRFGRDQGVFRIPVIGGKEVRIADMTNWHITGLMGFSMTLDPTDAPLVLRDTGRDDIYALTLEQK